MHRRIVGVSTLAILLLGAAGPALAQSQDQESRQAIIENAAAEKAKDLKPYEVTKAEKLMMRVERRFAGQVVRLHPFLEPAYSGGGFTIGSGYTFHPSAFSALDVRGSYSIRSYKLAEAEYSLPRLFDRRVDLDVRGGWRDATQVAFHGVGMDTPEEHLSWGFEQPYGIASVTVRPTRRLLVVGGGFEASEWRLKAGEGTYRSIDEVFTKRTLPGLDADTTYLHSHVTLAIDSRKSAAYARRGGYYGVTGHDYTDRDNTFGFQQVDYEAIQHIPLLRESWVLSLHGLMKTTWGKGDEDVPFFMMPSIGSGSTLRGYSSFRYRDRNSLLLQGEWRIIANRFVESAVFLDAGQVAERTSQFDVNKLKTDYGFGLRFHAPLATVLRIDVARSSQGTRLVFAASPAF